MTFLLSPTGFCLFSLSSLRISALFLSARQLDFKSAPPLLPSGLVWLTNTAFCRRSVHAISLHLFISYSQYVTARLEAVASTAGSDGRSKQN